MNPRRATASRTHGTRYTNQSETIHFVVRPISHTYDLLSVSCGGHGPHTTHSSLSDPFPSFLLWTQTFLSSAPLSSYQPQTPCSQVFRSLRCWPFLRCSSSRRFLRSLQNHYRSDRILIRIRQFWNQPSSISENWCCGQCSWWSAELDHSVKRLETSALSSCWMSDPRRRRIRGLSVFPWFSPIDPVQDRRTDQLELRNNLKMPDGPTHRIGSWGWWDRLESLCNPSNWNEDSPPRRWESQFANSSFRRLLHRCQDSHF